jgi:Lipocalin-like domain
MYQGNILRFCGIASAALFVLTSGVASQTQQKPAKELIAGNWILMIADNVRREGNNSPGFGPLPTGSATFGGDGRYSFEVTPNTGSQPGVKASGTYSLDEAGKTLTLKVEESSIPNWKGTTQNGTIKFVSGDHLGWTTSAPLAASDEFTGTELIWTRSK